MTEASRPEHGSDYSGFYCCVNEATTGVMAASTKPSHLCFPPAYPPTSAPFSSCHW